MPMTTYSQMDSSKEGWVCMQMKTQTDGQIGKEISYECMHLKGMETAFSALKGPIHIRHHYLIHHRGKHSLLIVLWVYSLDW